MTNLGMRLTFRRSIPVDANGRKNKNGIIPNGLSTSRGKEKSNSSWGSTMTVRRGTSKAMVSWLRISDRHVEMLDAGRMQGQTAETGGV